MATITSTNPFLGGGALPALPSVAPAAPAAPTPTVIKPTIPNLTMATSGSTTSGAPGLTIPKSLPLTTTPPAATPLSTFGQTPGVNLTTSGSTTPAMPVIPGTTPAAMAPNVTTSSGTTVNPNTGSVVTPASTGSGTGGGKAPAGYEYNGQGQLVPIGSDPGSSSGSYVPPSTSTPAVPNTGSTATTIPPPVPSTATGTGSQTTVAGAEGALTGASQYSPAELAAMQGLAALNTSYDTAYTNAEDQAIPLDFITGQQKVLSDREAQLAAPLTAQEQIEESKRQANVTAATSVLGTSAQQNTPIAISPGATAITPANPTTALGTNGGGSAQASTDMATSPTAPYGKPFDSSSNLDIATQQYMSTGVMPSNPVYAGMISQIQQRANQLSQQANLGPFNAGARQAQVQAATSTLTQQQETLSNTSGALQTLQQNSQLLLQGLQTNGLNSNQAPVFNQIQQAWESLGLNPADPNSAADVAQFTNSLTTLQAEYNKLLAGSGSTTEGGAARASEALPSGISVAGLGELFNRIIAEGNNKVNSLNTQIGTLNQQLNPYSFGGSSSGSNGGASSSSSGSSIYDF